jgi:Ni2+-binding GTPase involved in maturation of urease and hydrogenase
MERDAASMRGSRPCVFTSLRDGIGLAAVIAWVTSHVESHLASH